MTGSGTKRTSRDVRSSVATGGKPDIGRGAVRAALVNRFDLRNGALRERAEQDGKKDSHASVGSASCLAIFAMVARLQPVALWIEFHDCLALSMQAIPALRSVSSGRPL